MSALTVTVLGGGNAAHAVAGAAALAGHRVRMLEHPGRSSRLGAVADRRRIRVRRDGRIDDAPIDLVTTDAASALEGAQILFSTVSALGHRDAAELTVPYLRDNMLIVVFTGALGGLEWIAAARRRGDEPRFSVVETHTLPYAARVLNPGEVTILLDLKHVVGGVYPSSRTTEAAAVLSRLYPQIVFDRDLLAPTLCNVNGFLHPPVMLLNLTRIERARGRPWFVWEDGITQSIAALIERADSERSAIARAHGLDLMPLAELEWQSGYGPRGNIYETLIGSPSLRQIKGPSSVEERFFTEDIPYFLRVILDIGAIARVDAPLLRSLLEIGATVLGRDLWAEGRTLGSLGFSVSSAEELRRGLAQGFGETQARSVRARI